MNGAAGAVGGLVVFAFSLIAVLAVILILRELWCWLLKINEALLVLNDMKRVLRNIDVNIAASTKVATGEDRHFKDPA